MEIKILAVDSHTIDSLKIPQTVENVELCCCARFKECSRGKLFYLRRWWKILLPSTFMKEQNDTCKLICALLRRSCWALNYVDRMEFDTVCDVINIFVKWIFYESWERVETETITIAYHNAQKEKQLMKWNCWGSEMRHWACERIFTVDGDNVTVLHRNRVASLVFLFKNVLWDKIAFTRERNFIKSITRKWDSGSGIEEERSNFYYPLENFFMNPIETDKVSGKSFVLSSLPSPTCNFHK